MDFLETDLTLASFTKYIGNRVCLEICCQIEVLYTGNICKKNPHDAEDGWNNLVLSFTTWLRSESVELLDGFSIERKLKVDFF